VQRTTDRDRLTVVTRSARGRAFRDGDRSTVAAGRLRRSYVISSVGHQQTMRRDRPLVVHTPWTLTANPQAVTQAVPLPHLPPSPLVQGEHQIPGDRVVTDSGRRDPIGCV